MDKCLDLNIFNSFDTVVIELSKEYHKMFDDCNSAFSFYTGGKTIRRLPRDLSLPASGRVFFSCAIHPSEKVESL